MTGRISPKIAHRRSIGAVLVGLTCVALALSGCSRTPAPGDAGTTSTPTGTASSTPPAATQASDEAALKRVTGASSYEPSMNARIVGDVKQRLQYDRGASLTVAIRIDRSGAPVDLYFLRRTGELRSIAFGTRDGKLLQAYDQFSVSSGDQALDLVEKLGAKLPKQP